MTSGFSILARVLSEGKSPLKIPNGPASTELQVIIVMGEGLGKPLENPRFDRWLQADSKQSGLESEGTRRS